MEKIKPYYQVSLFILAVFTAFIVWHHNKDDDSSLQCLTHKITLEELEGMASKKDISVTQTDVDEINKMPLCKDMCQQQLEYSKEYADWFAEDDMRKTCLSLGISLPKEK